MSEKVNVGFSAPGSIWIEVDDPSDVDEVTKAFVEKLRDFDEAKLAELVETDPEWLAENMMYVDGEDGEVYYEW